MYYNSLKYRRGQIWKRKYKSTSFQEGVQSRNRPYLIISNNAGNASSPVVIALKITSNSIKSEKSINVPFINCDGEENVILCNQIETISKTELVDYIEEVNPEILDKVSESLALATGIEYKTDLHKTVSEIYKLLNKFEVAKANQISDVERDQNQISKTAEELQRLYIDLAKYWESSAEDLKSKTRLDPMNEYLVKRELTAQPVVEDSLEDEVNALKETTHKRVYRRWTKESLEAFFEDLKVLSREEMLNKYEVKSKASLSNMIWVNRQKYLKLTGHEYGSEE